MKRGAAVLARGARTSSAWALSLLFLSAGARCVTDIVSRLNPGMPTALLAGVAAGCALVGVAVFVTAGRLPRGVRHVLMVLLTAVSTLLVAISPTRFGVLLGAFAYPWAALYAALFMPRRAAFGYSALASAGFAAAVLATGLPQLFGAWVYVTVTVVAVTAVTTALVRAMQRQSETDPLTRVANRAGFERVAAHVLGSAARRGQPTTLIVCDVDGLKAVNDAGGHAAGDALLTGIVAAWSGALRSGDVLARLGGDEFAVLLPDTDARTADAVLRRLHEVSASAFSAGTASWTPGESLDALVRRADEAMYAVKVPRGRGHVLPQARRHPLEQPLPERA